MYHLKVETKKKQKTKIHQSKGELQERINEREREREIITSEDMIPKP